MFRPFVGEVISARLKESTEDGLCYCLCQCLLDTLMTYMFQSLYWPVPITLNLIQNTIFIDLFGDGVRWVWEYEGENYPIDGTDEIRFRVHNVSYPPIPLEQGKDIDERASEQKNLKPFAPMVVTGSLDADGLGPISWWV